MIMLKLYSLLLVKVLLLSSSSNSNNNFVQALPAVGSDYAFQSGPDHGNTYGSSIIYDSESQQIYISGSTYGSFWNFYDNNDYNDNVGDRITQSTCFVAVVNFETTYEIVSRIFPNPFVEVPESCKQLLVAQNFHPDNNNANSGVPLRDSKVLLLGNTRNGGTLNDLQHADQFTEKQYGMILDVDIFNHVQTTEDHYIGTEFLGGRILQDGPVQYPMGMVVAPTSSSNNKQEYYTGGDLYVVSMQSFDGSENDLYVNDASLTDSAKEEPDLNQLLEYGSQYILLVERFSPAYEDFIQQAAAETDTGGNHENKIHETWIDGWRKPYAPTYLNGETIHVTGITTTTVSSGQTTNLIVIGSTAAHGSIFGDPSMDDSSANIDGFLALLSAEDGSYLDSTIRIESINSKDDYITGFCQHENSNNLYIVGTTHGGMMEGDLDNLHDDLIPHAFIMNVDLQNFGVKWVKQVETPASDHGEVHGVACSVTNDGQYLYFGGTIKNPTGDELSSYGITESFGGDDIFLMQFEAGNGVGDHINYVKQWGTSHNDHLVDITTDDEGNALVLGNTNGSILRRKQNEDSTMDIFILTVSQSDGTIQEPMNQYGEDDDSNVDTSVKPDKNDIGSNSNNNDGDNTDSTNNDNNTDNNDSSNSNSDGDRTANNDNGSSTTDSRNNSDSNGRHRGRGIIVGIATTIFVAVLFCFCYCACRFCMYHHMDSGDVDRYQVVKYLDVFDTDNHDIDLKRSATGGWHGNYNNDLAEGLNHYGILQQHNPTLDNTNWRHRYDPEDNSSIRGTTTTEGGLPPPSSVNFTATAKKKQQHNHQMVSLISPDGVDDENNFTDEPIDSSYQDNNAARGKSIHSDNIQHLDALMNGNKPWNDDAEHTRVTPRGEHPVMTDII